MDSQIETILHYSAENTRLYCDGKDCPKGSHIGTMRCMDDPDPCDYKSAPYFLTTGDFWHWFVDYSMGDCYYYELANIVVAVYNLDTQINAKKYILEELPKHRYDIVMEIATKLGPKFVDLCKALNLESMK